jgi:ubiquinone/menaquinone biosynthesis C-methylase UbiE
MAPRFVAKQLSRPSGVFGIVIRHLMNRHNARMNAFAVGQLQLASSDHVLEIGFGGGATLPALLESAAFVAGVDRSHDVVGWATRHFAKAIETGRAKFCQGNVESLPFDEATFDKICTVNTVYFWTSLDAGFAEIYRVLKSGGQTIIGFLPKQKMDRMGMPTDIFTTRAPDDVVVAMRRVGFHNIRIERPTPETAWNVLVATR